MQLFHFPNLASTVKVFSFNKEESKHIVKVLRKKEGDELKVTNGVGDLFTTKIRLASPSTCEVEVVSVESFPKTHPYSLHMAVAPTKSNDRTEWFLEKATEIGVDEFSFLLCANSERKVIKEERFEKVVVSAMKQSLQFYLPKLNPLVSFESFITNTKYKQKFIAHCYDMPKQNLWDAIDIHSTEILILIGPEGDFSENEVQIAIENGFTPVSLSPNRLRTETASLVATHQVALKFQ
jgi:16S rRNA (uracil1498-N3)-methyltransferase